VEVPVSLVPGWYQDRQQKEETVKQVSELETEDGTVATGTGTGIFGVCRTGGLLTAGL